ncbi:MAG TPA: DUF370 domain-containing protein [Firmicutes bacterium]|nr:DUF370 domain-containing protein [Bacillota bacterium]
MYVSIGPGAAVRRRDIIGVFDLDQVTWSHRTRKSLTVCEQAGRVRSAGGDLPRSLVLCAARGRGRRSGPSTAKAAVVYLAPLSAAAVARRVESERI